MIKTYISDSYQDMIDALKEQAVLLVETTKLSDIRDRYEDDVDMKNHLDYDGNQSLQKLGKTYYLFETKKKAD